MSEVRLNILDAGRAIHGKIYGTEIDVLVAALSANPTTIEELQNATARFIKPVCGIKPFALFEAGTSNEPCESGISFVDLEARVVATEATYPNPLTQGLIFYHDGVKRTNISISYSVPDDWLLLNSLAEYECVRELRRAQYAAFPPLDTRAVLYGAVTEYIVRECLAARESKERDPVKDIHARWLMTPRDDLRGQSPRTAMLQQREFIEADLQSREIQWSVLGEPAPCLDPESAAYKFGGFGTHEIIVYYDLIRFLILKCWKRVNKKRNTSIADEVAWLQRMKTQWLERPEKDYEDKSAAYIIECERKRLPLAVPPDKEMFDDNCPLCRAMAGHTGPTFCHFDGSNMDDDFPFSLFLTSEEWEEEKQLMGEYDEEFEERTKEPFDEGGRHRGNPPMIH